MTSGRFFTRSSVATNGFTLIEVLVSASILGIISLAVLTTFGSGLHVYERIQSYGGLQANVLLALEEMEKDINNTFPLLTVPFKGDAGKIAFAALIDKVVTVEDEEKIIPAIGKISYFVEEEDGQKMLARSKWDYPDATSDAQTQDDQKEFLAQIKEIRFSYYYIDEETMEYGWEESWSSEEGEIPSAVKISLTYEDRGQDIQLERTVLIPTVRVVEEKEEDEEEDDA